MYAVYETHVTDDDRVLCFDEVRDRVFAFLDGAPIGTIERTQHQCSIVLPRGGRLRLLVEDLGRVNYAKRLGESKGLVGPARTAVREITVWEAAPLGHASLPAHAVDPQPLDADRPVAGPVLLSGTFDAEPGRDLFLDTTSFGTDSSGSTASCSGATGRPGRPRPCSSPARCSPKGATASSYGSWTRRCALSPTSSPNPDSATPRLRREPMKDRPRQRRCHD